MWQANWACQESGRGLQSAVTIFNCTRAMLALLLIIMYVWESPFGVLVQFWFYIPFNSLSHLRITFSKYWPKFRTFVCTICCLYVIVPLSHLAFFRTKFYSPHYCFWTAQRFNCPNVEDDLPLPISILVRRIFQTRSIDELSCCGYTHEWGSLVVERDFLVIIVTG